MSSIGNVRGNNGVYITINVHVNPRVKPTFPILCAVDARSINFRFCGVVNLHGTSQYRHNITYGLNGHGITQ